MGKEKVIYDKEKLVESIRNGKTTPDLPEAGYKRDDVLAARKDELAEVAERLSENKFAIPEDSEALKEDREILDKLVHKDYFHVDLKEPGKYKTRFVNMISNRGSAFWMAKAEGWEVVKPEMVVEYDQFKVSSENDIRVGDVILMYMPIEKYEKILEDRRKAQYMQQFGLEAPAVDLANKYSHAMKFYSNLQGENPYLNRMEKSAAQRTALQHVGNKMKSGYIPGLPNH